MSICTRMVTSGEFHACWRRVSPPAMEVRGAPAAMRRLTTLRRLDVTARERAWVERPPTGSRGAPWQRSSETFTTSSPEPMTVNSSSYRSSGFSAFWETRERIWFSLFS